MHFHILSLGLLAATVYAAPAPEYALHEKRSHIPAGWAKNSDLEKSYELPVKIALSQSNLHRANEFLMEVSHPKSEKYGQHWTAKQVAEMFAPSQDSVNAVKEWLAGSSIDVSKISTSKSGGWLNFPASIEQLERLLKAEYSLYEHSDGTVHVACEAYSIPHSLKSHIDFITPTVHFDAKVDRHAVGKSLKKRQSRKAAIGRVIPDDSKATGVGSPSSGNLPKPGRKISTNEMQQILLSGTSQCNEAITPDCLRALYKLPTNSSAVNVAGNSYGIVEYTPQSYLPSDLDLFFTNFSSDLIGSRPVFDSIDGGVLIDEESFGINGESNLDLQYAMTLVYPLNVTLYQTGDDVEGASFNNFLDALDASYCSGDDPDFDGIYPDTFSSSGYKFDDCGNYTSANVLSTSYGYDELDLTPAYEERQCNEYMKLGLQGVSILYSSGDNGVAGNGGVCFNTTTGEFTDGDSGRFVPGFPGGCPFITSVGATQVGTNSTVSDPETASETVIFSGGGFSDVFAMPDYQKEAIATYYELHDPGYTAEQYNNSQTVRGFPDVSANGVNYVIALDGDFELVFGTSASSPTFGSIVTLLNGERIQAGKSPVGFLNPVLYAHPEVLNDITAGTNEGCGTVGFTAVTGWDPVTGLGTANYPKMLELFLSLP